MTEIEHVKFVDSLNISGIKDYPDFKIDVGVLQSKEIQFSRSEKIDSDKLYYLIKHCIDLDEWKHSWHKKIGNPENYDFFIKVIQEKIMKRDHEIRILFECLFRLYNQKSTIASGGE